MLIYITKHKQVLESGEVALDDDETGATVGNPTKFTSFEDIFNSVDDGLFKSKVTPLVDESDIKNVSQDQSVKIVDDVNDPQLQSKDFSVHDIHASSSVVSNVEKMRTIRGKTIVEDKQVVDRPRKVQKVHLVSSTSEPILHFTTQVEHRLVFFCSPYFVSLFQQFWLYQYFIKFIIEFSVF
ncbi:hypothetical protein Hanom_Chr00s018600g01758231 [Helianthus anomalus]